jgi:nitroreductase
MEVIEAIKSRRSIRKFKEEKIDKNTLEKIIEAARLSPSAMNNQPWHFIIVSDKKRLNAINEACNQNWNAPHIIIPVINPEKSWVRSDGENYWQIDMAISTQSMVLTAWEEGLGTCWVGAFDEERIKKSLGIPEKMRVMVILPIGYPDQERGIVENRKQHEILHYDNW